MHVQLRHHVAERGDVELVASGDILQRRAVAAISPISCTCSFLEIDEFDTPDRRGTRSSQG